LQEAQENGVAIGHFNISDLVLLKAVRSRAGTERSSLGWFVRRREADHLAMGISLIASTRGVALLPVYAQNFLPSSVTSRPLKGDTPTIDLVLGHKRSNKSPVLKLLLSKLDELVDRASSKKIQ